MAEDGWDNTTFRLGQELAVRLPSASAYEAQVAKEQRWLPLLAAKLPLAIPAPVAEGRPGAGFPRRWSVYRWLEGDRATRDRVTDMSEVATALADFLVALRGVDAIGVPRPGMHNFFRGGAVATYDGEVRDAIDALGNRIDSRAALEVWDAALRTHWTGTPVWVHGDISPDNLLLVGGRLAAVIDFGCCAAGDPACDLAIAYTFFDGNAREAFRDRVGLDSATWARARGWALWKALIRLQAGRQGAAGTFDVRRVIDEVVSEHKASQSRV